MRAPTVLPFATMLALALPAQSRADDPPGHSRHGEEFDTGPRQAAHLMTGLGTAVHFPVAGLSPAAQRLFDQGICQQHGFWYFEAERSFREVARLHPDCAMAYWGMAMANVENPQRAAGFAAQAVQRRANATATERRWLDAIAGLYQIDAAASAELQSADAARVAAARAAIRTKNKTRDEGQLGRQFVRDLEAIVFAAPDDIEAKAFLAIQSWRNTEHGVPISSHGAVDALLAQVFAAAPLHPAHHYRIHLWDDDHPERALASAAQNGASAPAIAHQWHMAGHTYAGLHRHAEAAWQQEASGRADHAHMASDRVMPFLIHNYGHNQEWLSRSLSYCGRVTAALDVARNLAELPRHPELNRLDHRRDIAGYARARLLQLCEEHELWDEAQRLEHAGFLEPSDEVVVEVDRLALLGRAHCRLGNAEGVAQIDHEVLALLAKARAARAAAIDEAEATAVLRRDPDDRIREQREAAGRERSDAVRAVLDLQRELRGEHLLAAGDAPAALAEFAAIKGLPRVLLADVHIAAGDVAQGIEVLEREVHERPHRAPSLLRLIAALEQSGRGAAAAPLRCELLQYCGVPEPTPLVRRLGLVFPTQPGGESPRFGDDFGPRPPLDSLGPLHWQPVANAGFDLPRVGEPVPASVALYPDGRREHRGSAAATPTTRGATLVVFYLGFGCLHCVEQLHALRPRAAAFAAAGIDVVAIGNDAPARAAAALQALAPTEQPPFPLLADPDLVAFKAWHCHDDFEQLPLHGTFLVDSSGRVRWQDIGAEPFLQLDWLLAESKRLLGLPANVGSR